MEITRPAPDVSAAAERVCGAFAAVEAAMREAVETLIVAGPGSSIAGLPAQVWLEHRCRVLPGEARRILGVAEVLPDLPALRTIWGRGQVTFAQVRTIVGSAARLRVADRQVLDRRVAAAVADLDGAGPGELLDVVEGVVDQLRHQALADAERRAERGQFLAVSPFVTGDGGSIYAEYGAVGLATIVEWIDAAAPTPDVQADPDGNPTVRAGNRRAVGQARAEGLLRLAAVAGTRPDPTGHAPEHTHADADAAQADRAPDAATADDPALRSRLARRPLLLASVDLETLLRLARRPGRLLTTLTGGTLRCSAAAARQLAATPQGADLRLVVHDTDGATVGVGRTARLAPGWLRQATWTQHATCAFPSCRRPARTAQLDHTAPWDPDPASPGGRTEAGNLTPLCASHHRWKTTGRWQLTRHPDGTCVWTHPATGDTLLQPSLLRLDRLAAGLPTPGHPEGRPADAHTTDDPTHDPRDAAAVRRRPH